MVKSGISKIAPVILLIFLFASCGNFENIEFGDPQDFKVKGFEDNFLMVNVNVPVKNPTIYRINLKEIDVRVFLNGKYIGKLLIDDNVIIKGKESRTCELPVKVRLNNLLGAAFIMMNLKKGQQVEVKFEGTITAKTFLLKKTVEIDDVVNFVI